MRICYLILVHHKFQQATRLIRRLQAPNVKFVVHIDKKVPDAHVNAFKESLSTVAAISYAPRVDARWGSFNLALAIMHGIETVVAAGLDFDRCILLSGQDYPIASNAEIVSFFRAHSASEFVEAYPLDLVDPNTRGWTPYYRFRLYHFWLGRRRFTLPLLRKQLPQKYIFHGSTWWALSRDAIQHVARTFSDDSALRRYLATGFLVDEVYVPTLLMNSKYAERVTGVNVTFAQWTPSSGPHPKTLELHDVKMLADSSKLYARKFDASVNASALDALDALHVQGSNVDTATAPQALPSNQL